MGAEYRCDLCDSVGRDSLVAVANWVPVDVRGVCRECAGELERISERHDRQKRDEQVAFLRGVKSLIPVPQRYDWMLPGFRDSVRVVAALWWALLVAVITLAPIAAACWWWQ